MNYLARKKRAFMPILTKIRGFERVARGVREATLEACVDAKSVIDYEITAGGVGLGDATDNLFDSSQLLEATGWQKNDNGEYFGDISELWSKFSYYGTFRIDIPADANKIYISFDGKNKEKNTTTFAFAIFYTDGTKTTNKGFVQSTDWVHHSFESVSGKKIASVQAWYSHSDVIYLKNIMISTKKPSVYEPYGEYKIPLKITSAEVEENIYIFRTAPLAAGEKISKKADNLPDIPVFWGNTKIEAKTEWAPREMTFYYYAFEKGNEN